MSDCPHTWLREYIAKNDDLTGEAILDYLYRVIEHVDHDSLETIFEEEMTEDGYWDDEEEE